MKIKTLQRDAGASTQRECSGDLRRTARNLNPTYHPMQRAREYTRAVTAAKMERMFAQPLIAGNLRNINNGGTFGHMDAVTCTALSRKALSPLVSGAADGQVQLWDLQTRQSVAMVCLQNAHHRAVTGVVFDTRGQGFYSCSDDGLVHKWSLHANNDNSTQQDLDSKPSASIKSRHVSSSSSSSQEQQQQQPTHVPVATWRCNGSFKSIDQSWIGEDRFATASDEAVQIWSPERGTAIQTHADLWGSGGGDTVTTVRFHPIEPHLLAHVTADRGIGLHDLRTSRALKKTVLHMRSNDLQWNPMEPMNFVVANEDYNAHLFDMRKLNQPTRICKGHTAACMSVSWSPTGREFVTGSYDKTMRIFNVLKDGAGQARDVYHTKRMQRVFCVNYTLDNKFIVSGSDEGNIRLWKARASEPLGGGPSNSSQLLPREEAAMRYRSTLIQRYQHLPDVRKITKSRKLPKVIRNQTAQARIMKESADRKQANRVKYNNSSSSTSTSHSSNCNHKKRPPPSAASAAAAAAQAAAEADGGSSNQRDKQKAANINEQTTTKKPKHTFVSERKKIVVKEVD
jgi:DDB1- and CUL4-associated factor 13